MTRIERIREKLPCENSAIIITSDSNRFYASGFISSAGYILVSHSEARLYLDFRYYEMAKLAKENGNLQPEISVFLIDKGRGEYLSEFIGSSGIDKLLYENYSLTVSELASLEKDVNGLCKLVCANAVLSQCRAVKDSAEISAISNAQAITDKAFEHILTLLNPDITEADVALELEYFMRKNGADGIAFDTISVCGAKSSLPHGKPENVKLGHGFLTMDFGAKYHGYCSDMTRTVCIGNPTDEMLKVYNTVLEAQYRAFDVIHSGVIGKTVDAAARDYINSKGYKGCFGHSLGHSLGIDIHESPGFSISCEAEIPENAVVSVEPGIYLEGKFGVRIEDIVKITANGYENLTKSPKDLIII